MFETIENPKFAPIPNDLTTDDPLWMISLAQITRHNEHYWTDVDDIHTYNAYETIIKDKVKDKDKNTILHSAVESLDRNMEEVVAMIMEADPENFAAQQKDREGNLPIHSACERRKPNGAVISMLADMFPGGLQKKDKDGGMGS